MQHTFKQKVTIAATYLFSFFLFNQTFLRALLLFKPILIE